MTTSTNDFPTEEELMGDLMNDGFAGDSSFNPDAFDDWGSDGVDGSDIGSGRIVVDIPGWYLLQIDPVARPSRYGTDKAGNVDMTYSRKPDINCVCAVLATLPNQCPVGAVHYHSLIMGGKGPGVPIEPRDKENALNFLVGIGVLRTVDGKVIDPETGTQRINAATLTQRLKGVKFIAHLKLERGGPMTDRVTKEPIIDPETGKQKMWRDRFGLAFGRGAFKLDDPRVAHLLPQLGVGSGGTGHAPQKSAATPATAHAKTAKSNPLDDLDA